MTVSINPITGYTGPYHRWYDQESACRQIIHDLQQIDNEDVLEFAAELIWRVSDQMQTQLRAKAPSIPRTLGLAGIKELYMSKTNHRRWYDQSPMLKRAIGSFYLLPPEGLTALCFKLKDTIGFLSLYSFVCAQLSQPARPEDLTNIVRQSLFDGKEGVETFLSDLVGKDLFDALVSELS